MYTVMIEWIQNQKNHLQVYVLIENLHRKATLFKDFPHLYPTPYASEKDFQQSNCNHNLIKLTLFPDFDIEKLSNSEKGSVILEEFSYMAESLVEHHLQTDHAIRWIENSRISTFQNLYSFEKHAEWKQSIVNYILSFAENPPPDTDTTYLF